MYLCLVRLFILGWVVTPIVSNDSKKSYSELDSNELRSLLLNAIERPRGLPKPSEPQETPEASLDVPTEDKDGLSWERWTVWSEPSQLGKVPVLVIRPSHISSGLRLPCIIVLHPTGGSKENVQDHLVRYARLGFVAVAFDLCHHGERGGINQYYQSLVTAWHDKGTRERPFIYDMVWDCLRVIDMLVTRADIDDARLGITGISLGGMVAWFAAAADVRIAASVPAIGVQSFRFALEFNQWHARVDSIRPVFEVAAEEMGKKVINEDVVRAVWDVITPGLIELFDAGASLCLIAPRLLFVVNGLQDPRCPAAGVQQAFRNATNCWNSSGSRPELLLEEGVGHAISFNMWQHIDKFFIEHLSENRGALRSEL